jgi:hypothetical protein
VIGHVFFFAAAVWFNWFIARLLYVAATRGYVMALTRPFVDTVDTPQTRKDNPQKFWANVIVALILVPVALGGLYFSSTELYAALRG